MEEVGQEDNNEIPRGNQESGYEDPNILQPQAPAFFLNLLYFVQWVLISYGWFLLFVTVSSLMLWTGFLGPRLRKWLQKRREFQMDAELHRNPDLAISRQEAMIAARERLQQQHDLLAVIHKEKQEQKEEDERRKKIEEWEKHKAGKGYHSKYRVHEEPATVNPASGTTDKTKPRLRTNEYNPLSGSGGSSGYRPAPKSKGCGGGGCGK